MKGVTRSLGLIPERCGEITEPPRPVQQCLDQHEERESNPPLPITLNRRPVAGREVARVSSADPSFTTHGDRWGSERRSPLPVRNNRWMHVSVSPEELESSTCRLEVGRSGPVELRAQGRVLGRNRTDAGGFAGHCLAAWRRGRRSPGGNRTLSLPVRNRASLSVGPRGCQHLKNPARDSNPEPRLSESRVRPLHFRGMGIECPGLEPGAPAVRRRCASVAPALC